MALVVGVAVGVTEAMFAIAFASLVFGGRIASFLPPGIGLYLGAAFLTLVILAWRAGTRGVVGGLQATSAAMLSIVAATAGIGAYGGPLAGFLTVVAATLIVTVTCGLTFLILGIRRRGDLIRYVPVPVAGGLVAGLGWVLVQGGIHVAANQPMFYARLGVFLEGKSMRLWLPAVGFGVLSLLAVRIVKKPLVLPVIVGIGLVLFALAARAMGASIADVRRGGWLLGPFFSDVAWKTWSFQAVTEADWLAVARAWVPIAVAVVVAPVVMLLNLSGSEDALDRDLDTDREFRDAGMLNVISGVLGGIPGYHEISLTSWAGRMRADARRAGLIGAAIPLAALLFGGRIFQLMPRMILGGVLVFVGLSFIVEWVWDRRSSLPRVEYVVVVVILFVVMVRGFVPGFVVGLVLAFLLLAISYGRVDLVREVEFGDVYRSNVDRSRAERDRLRALADKVQILRVSGHMFFGSTNQLLERIRARAEAGASPRFLVIDLQHVTGVDASALAALTKAERLASAEHAEIVLTGASEAVRTRLERGGVLGTEGLVSFEPDLDRGLRRCEEALLVDTGFSDGADASPGGVPPRLAPYLEQVTVAEGAVLLRQEDPPGDIYVLADGRLSVETSTPEGRRVRLRTLRPGVVVGEVALYSGTPRTADVVAETDCVVLRCSREQIERMEAEDPVAAAELHRWLAGTLADRLSDTLRTYDALLD